MTEKMVTITMARYRELLRDEIMLIELESNGVDNWDGYDHATDTADAIIEQAGLIG